MGSGADTNGDGYISFCTFLSATLPHSFRRNGDLCKKVFNLLDQNADGFIDEEDLKATFIARTAQPDTSFDSVFTAVLAEVTGGRKDRLDFAEFFRVMASPKRARRTRTACADW